MGEEIGSAMIVVGSPRSVESVGNEKIVQLIKLSIGCLCSIFFFLSEFQMENSQYKLKDE